MFICSRCSAENNPAVTFWEPDEDPRKIWATCSTCNTYAKHSYFGAHTLGIQKLLGQQLAVVDILTSSVRKVGEAISDFVVRPIPQGESEIYYVKLLARLASVHLSPEEAAVEWGHILDHKWYMSENEGRDVGIEVAALDYFKNIRPMKPTKKPVT